MAKTKDHWKWMNEEYGKWLTKLDQELLRRTWQCTEGFSDYPYAEDFIMRHTPEETATMMIESSGIIEKKPPRRVINLNDTEMLFRLAQKIKRRIDFGCERPDDEKKLINIICHYLDNERRENWITETYEMPEGDTPISGVK